ncbi:MAG: D-alanyl-D-alanine carboxypeptidase [Pseudomonadota bacterium]
MTAVVRSRRLPVVLILVALIPALMLGLGSRAEAAPYAAVVMDMRTGKVVHARSADRQQHPASLTKMMTLYLAFEAVRNGQLRLDQRVRVSRHAARQPASKLYLKAGQRVTIRSLIRATAIKSANDAAMVLAEAIGGSQRAFAQMMTNKARQLGMSKTRFHNPHGLTQRGHVSTARDMARLARHLYFDFPEYYNVFGRKMASAAGKRVYTTNRLLATYRGAEGMKTGYTRAAGYNLVATAKRGERRVVAVVMGGKSSRWRNRRVAELLDMGFARTPRRAREVRPRGPIVQVARAPIPRARPVEVASGSAAGLAAIGAALAPAPAMAATDTGSRLAPLYAVIPLRRPGAASPAEQAEAEAIVAEVAARIQAVSGSLVALPPVRASQPEAPAWEVQVGAYRDRSSARAGLKRFEIAGLPMLSRDAMTIKEGRSRSGRPLYTVRFLGLDQGTAREACAQIKASGRDCLALAPR